MGIRAMRAVIAGALLGAVLVTVQTLTPALVAPAHAAGERILITGDSITHGSSGDYTWRYRLWKKLQGTAPGVAFVGPRYDLYDPVNDQHGSPYYAAAFTDPYHGAKWGGSFHHDGAGITNMVAAAAPDVLVAMLGSNDLAYLTSPAQTIANLRTYISRARTAKPGIDIVVGEVVNRYDPWNQTYWMTSQVNTYANLLADMAADLNTPSERVVVAHTRSGWDAQSMTWDGTHPNPTGEALIAQRVSGALAQLGIGTAAPDISGTYAWQVMGPKPAVSGGVETADLSWNRTTTGATGMKIWARVVNDNPEPWWDEWPYPVSGDNWHATGLVPGGKYEFAVQPVKGNMLGVPGLKTSVQVGSRSLGSTGAPVVYSYRNDSGASVVDVGWTAATNATGYWLASRNRSRQQSYSTLPYQFTGLHWTFTYLEPGIRYRFRITPARGYASGNPSRSPVVRTLGLPANIAHAVLGDSYSAGLGSMDPEESGSCKASTGGWAKHFASLYVTARKWIACSDKTTSHVRSSQISDMETFFAQNPSKAKVITMTIGGNDVNFGNRIRGCVTLGCDDAEAAINADIDAVEETLFETYRELRQAAPNADIIVGGYPGVVHRYSSDSNNVGCTRLNNVERQIINRAASRLNSRIMSAAEAAGVWHVGQGVQVLFEGKNACADTEWVHSVNGEWGGEVLGIIDAKSFHPNDTGQSWYVYPFNQMYNYYSG